MHHLTAVICQSSEISLKASVSCIYSYTVHKLPTNKYSAFENKSILKIIYEYSK